MKTKAGLLMVQCGIVLAMLTSCNNSEDAQREELQRIRTVSAELSKEAGERIVKERAEVQKEMDETLGEIDQRLDLIKSQRGIITLDTKSGDLHVSKKEEIISNIALIDELLEDNNKKIKALEAKVRKIAGGNKQLEEQLAQVRQRNSEVETEITALRDELFKERQKSESLTKELGDRNAAYAELKTKWEKADDDAYSVYYISGTRKELKKKKVTEGTVFSRELSAGVNHSSFKKVDMRAVTSIPVEAKKAKLVTEHDEKSYKWQDNTDGTKSLTITNPDSFWKTSKFLVIETRS
jgi:DNA repair exonuclease SbcCD ATPase subunit